MGWVDTSAGVRYVIMLVTGVLFTIWDRVLGHTACFLGLYRIGYGVPKIVYFSYKAIIRYQVHTVLYKAVFNVVSSIILEQNVEQTVKNMWINAF